MLSVGRVMEQSAVTYANAPKSSEEVSQTKNTTLAADSTDEFVRSGASFHPAYTKETVTDNRSNNANDSTAPDTKASEAAEKRQAEAAAKKKAEENAKAAEAVKPKPNLSVKQTKNALMQDMVKNTLSGQVGDSRKSDARRELEEIIRSYSEPTENEEQDEDYWSSDSTANRILDFAKQLAGDDDEAFGTLKDAFEKAFAESEKLLGGKGNMPSVSYDTYDKVQKGFDDWAKKIAEKKALEKEAQVDTDKPEKLEAEK